MRMKYEINPDVLLQLYREYDKIRTELVELKREQESVDVSVTCTCGVTTIERRKV